MKKRNFSIAYKDEALADLVSQSSHQVLATWAIACAERVLLCFEGNYQEDTRPRQALETLQTWLETGVFKMAIIRGASLAAHAAAREVGEDSAARSAARAAGQAVATAHVATHSLAAANYALQAVYRDADVDGADTAVVAERKWQYQHLLKLSEQG